MANAWNTTELSDSQVGKVASVNLAVKFLQSFLTGVRDIATSVPGSPVENGMYIAGSGSISGAWAAYTVNDLCFYFGAAWYKVDAAGRDARAGLGRGCLLRLHRQRLGDGAPGAERYAAGPPHQFAHMQTSDGAQTLYTVPTGKKLIPTRVVVRNPTASLAGATDINFGDGTNRDTWKANVDLSGMTATTDVMVITNDNAKFTPFDAGDTFGFKPDTGATADADATMEVFGYLY